MRLTKYSGCTLEVFDVNIDELRQSRMSQIIDTLPPHEDTFVRSTTVSIGGVATHDMASHGIDYFLSEVDRGMQEITTAASVGVVWHEWGLIRRSSPHFYYRDELAIFGITDYVLGARVQRLQGHTLSRASEHFISLPIALNKAVKTFRKENGWGFLDIARPVQFTQPPVEKGISVPILHDIEPRLY